MVAISRACSVSLMPSALRAVRDCARRRLRFSKDAGVVSAVAIEFGEHEGLEGVVNGGGDFSGDDAVAFGVDEEDACGGVKLVEISATRSCSELRAKRYAASIIGR